MSSIEFLSHKEVCELTNARTKAGQINNLIKNGIRHSIKRNGWPSVTTAAVIGIGPMSNELEIQSWKPRKAG